MRISGSGRKRNEERTVTLTLTGTDREFVRLIDALEMLPDDMAQELCRQINYRAGTLVDLPAPRSVIHP